MKIEPHPGISLSRSASETRYQTNGKRSEAIAARQGLVCYDPLSFLTDHNKPKKIPLRGFAPLRETFGFSGFRSKKSVLVCAFESFVRDKKILIITDLGERFL